MTRCRYQIPFSTSVLHSRRSIRTSDQKAHTKQGQEFLRGLFCLRRLQMYHRHHFEKPGGRESTFVTSKVTLISFPKTHTFREFSCPFIQHFRYSSLSSNVFEILFAAWQNTILKNSSYWDRVGWIPKLLFELVQDQDSIYLTVDLESQCK